MCHANNERRKTANDGRNCTTKSKKKKVRTLGEKETWEYWKWTPSKSGAEIKKN